jgi:hypothetical protein
VFSSEGRDKFLLQELGRTLRACLAKARYEAEVAEGTGG